MKIKRLEIKNIGIIKDEVIEINKPLNLFYGDLRQGKTTILNSVKLCFGGSFPDDILHHGSEEGYVKMFFDNASITREFYKGRDGTTKAREIVLIKDGELVKRPVEELRNFINPFLLDNEFLMKLSAQKRQEYYLDFLGVDTKDLDSEYKTIDDEARELRYQVKAYDNPALNHPVEPVDIESLQEEKKKIREQNESLSAEYNKKFSEFQEREGHIRSANERKKEKEDQIKRLQEEISAIDKWLKDNKPLAVPGTPEYISLEEVEQKILDAATRNAQAEEYKKAVKKEKSHNERVEELQKKESRLREIRKEKIKSLSKVAENCQIEGLTFDENGNLMFEDTAIDMASTSQLLRLSKRTSDLYPQGLGLTLIDRGESLGTSIFEFIEDAKTNEKTILATIVGEKPAKVPKEVGVFVVKEGKVNDTQKSKNN